MLRNLH